MQRRIIYHVAFWLVYVLFFALVKVSFSAPSDLAYPLPTRFLRFVLSETVALPWKIIPFYLLFYYLIPLYFQAQAYIKLGFFFLLSIVLCTLGYRAMITPLNEFLYNSGPGYDVYSWNRLLYTLTDIIPTIGLAATAKLLKGKLQFFQREQKLREEKLKSELNFLRAQTHPHFLFNTLNNLYGLARKNNKNTADSILKLSNIMRYILYECTTSTIAIWQEIKLIEDYISLEKLRYNDRLQVSFDYHLDDKKREIAPLILLPFVENAFKHGTSETRFDSFVHVTLRLEDNQFFFEVKNSFDKEEMLEKSGIGLKNVRRQLELIYGDKHELDIVPKADIFSISLHINLFENA